jgi:hypothetical protein
MIGNRFAAICSIAVIAMAFPAAAGDDCATFPTVALWGQYTHDTVRKHVNETLAGDWTAYVGELQRQLEALRKIHARGSGVAITRDGRTVNLRDDSLDQYIKHADRRLGIARCLAANAEAETVAAFSTAAGATSEPPAAADDEAMRRTYLTLPEDVLARLRKMAVRRSVKENRQVSVSEIVVEFLERELRRSRR